MVIAVYYLQKQRYRLALTTSEMSSLYFLTHCNYVDTSFAIFARLVSKLSKIIVFLVIAGANLHIDRNECICRYLRD